MTKRSKKFSYIAYELLGDGIMPSGEKTRFAGSRHGADMLAKEYGFRLYEVQRACFCFLYRKRISLEWEKPKRNFRKIIRLSIAALLRHIRDKLNAKSNNNASKGIATSE